jgi:hypothetical protein
MGLWPRGSNFVRLQKRFFRAKEKNKIRRSGEGGNSGAKSRRRKPEESALFPTLLFLLPET